MPGSLKSHNALIFNFTDHSLTTNKIPFSAFENCPQMKPSLIKPISISDMPFFCALECKVRKKSTIWIKLRAGDDASYMKMITGNLIER